MRCLTTLALLAALSACAAPSGSLTAACRGTIQSREAHGVALLTPPTDRRDFETGEQVLAEIGAACAVVGER